MRMLLQPRLFNGFFGDSALYISEMNSKEALLIDCGDLSRLSNREILKISHIFISHCHIDHFFGFDLLLRTIVGSDKTVTIYGPPETSKRVGGKLQGYTWNLLEGHYLEFIVVDLYPEERKKIITSFHAKDAFHASSPREESWDPLSPVYNAETFTVHTTLLDHRTPSLAYCVEEKSTVQVDTAALEKNKLIPGAWINTLKDLYLFGGLEGKSLEVPLQGGLKKQIKAADLANEILIPRQRHKVAYATDGAPSKENRAKLIQLISSADLFFSETCFVQDDIALALETKHFTAEFIAKLASEAHVKQLAPFHFSKRYIENPDRVLGEVKTYFSGEVVIAVLTGN